MYFSDIVECFENPKKLKTFEGLERSAISLEIHCLQRGLIPFGYAPYLGATDEQIKAFIVEARCKPNQCVHQWAKNAPKRRRTRKAKKQVFPEGFKPVKKQDSISRIGGDNSETITGSDGKPSTFSQVGINHFSSKKRDERNNRLRSLGIAQDTVKTGLHFESLKEGKPQTEFIKSYNDTFFYTARRDENGMVYTWHEIREEKYNKKLEAYKAYVENGTIQ